MAEVLTPSVDTELRKGAPEVIVTAGISGTWQVVCGCGYRALDIADRVMAHLVAAKHCVATQHRPA